MFKILVLFIIGFAIGFGFNTLNHARDEALKPEVKVVSKVVVNPDIPSSIQVFHDKRRGVTCYYKEHSNAFPSSALSCVPDAQLRISQ